MDGTARLRVEVGPDGRTLARHLEEAPPVAFRRCGDEYYLVATAAGPIGTDRVSVVVEVGQGASAVVRSVGAMIAYSGSDARLDVSAVVEEDGSLAWLPEPLIATGSCTLSARTTITMAASAAVEWREELVLGRHGEAPGRVHHRIGVDVGGRPLLRHELALGPGEPGWAGPAVLSDNRAVGFRLVAGTDCTGVAGAGDGWATVPLDGPGVLTMAVAADAATLRRRLHQTPGCWPSPLSGRDNNDGGRR